MAVASDRFSSLPDSVLLHILSFLPFDDVVRTSRLCKQWRTLWCFSSFLNFIHRPKDLVSLKKFVSFVDKSLINLHCNCNTVSRIHLDFPFKRCFTSDVTVWVLFAVSYKVKELNLILANDAEDAYCLPKRLFLNSSLEKVNWVSCRFEKIEVVRWDSLRELRIGSMEFRDDMVRKVVVGSPCLELLELDNCWGFKRLDLVGGKVSKLVVNGYREVSTLDFEVEIEAPCVKVLELKGCFRMNIQLKNVMNCVSAKLDYHFKIPKEEERSNFYEQQRHILMAMFGSLRHVKDVMFGTWCIETCFVPVVHDVYSVGGKFQLSMLSKDWGLNLKKVKVCGFEGMRSGLEVLFLRDLLLVSANLEEMVIEWRRSGHQNSIPDPSDDFVTESLLNVRGRSKNAVILFKN
ncbi:hypothetical protein T459_05813 [Capsicum annuum]|uniref:F-box domain-containing protein n=1 Tax=Capsicum annuum TaxID=4072 RepID=A0A2G3A917_CAPAN|nr:hypothetical protein T459_05813 [Capsicum annuum]